MTHGLIWRDPGELPAEVTGFVGRQRELAVLDGLLGTARLVTVTGPGGVGKTRVALRAAARGRGQFADGVCLAELGWLHDPDLLPHTVATCLGLPGQDTGSQADAIVEYLRGRQLLLILDSCEHLIGACAALAEPVLRYAAQVTILATSRQPMNVPGEHCCPVPPLPVPEPGSSLDGAGWGGRGDAVELFAQRAAAASPGFAVTSANRRDVIQLCGRLDGIPLAIELAAVQLRTLTLQQLTSRLERRFSLLTTGRRGALPHQQTLRATTQWSYDLCSPEEELLWARLSVFAGSFDLAAAEAVCVGGPLAREDILPTLVGLVDKSVMLRTEEDAARYWLLDTIREFGAERLAERGETDEDRTKDRHIGYFRAMAGDFSRHDKDDDQLPRYRRLRGEHPDLRAALGYALDRPGRAGEAARMAADLRAYWAISGLLREGKHWLTKILLRFPGPSAERAWLLMTRGVLSALQGELGQAVSDLELCIPMAQQHGEVLACALGHAYLCLAFTFSGRHAEAAAAGDVAAERLRALDHVSGLVGLDINLGYLHLVSGEFDLAIERCELGLRRLGESERWARGYLQIIIARALFFQGKYAESAAAARSSLEKKHELGDIVGTAFCLEALAMLAARQQRCERAAWLMGAADTLWDRIGRRLGNTSIMEELHQQAVKAAQDALGDTRYAALFRDGAGRPLDLVVRLAVTDADQLPATPGRQRPGGLLTGRERQIAALVGEGMSNRDIAQQLGISKRTVDAHLEHIFGKLGISSRVQLATRLTPSAPSPDRPPPPPGPPEP